MSHVNSIEKELIDYLKSIGQVNPEINAEQLLSIEGGFIERFKFFAPFIPNDFKKNILISGCAVGSELIAALQFDFIHATGTEVTAEYVSMAKKRIQSYSNMHVDLYDGIRLPYPDESFTTVYSGHIIEHTPSPFEYFKEHMRVLIPGGYFFLEFPNRYHHTELHTGEFSLEYLPKSLRDFIIVKFILKAPFLSKARKHNYRAIAETLHPISNRMIKEFFKKVFKQPLTLEAEQIPHPGFSRILLRKPK